MSKREVSGLSQKSLPLGPRESPGVEIPASGSYVSKYGPTCGNSTAGALTRSQCKGFLGKTTRSVIFAAGGTGGHLFPAQALAKQLLHACPDIDLLFAGARLSTNAYLDKTAFSYCDVASTTPFQGGILGKVKSVFVLLKGIRESLRILSRTKPDLVVGFGSFHAFPVLCAAAIKKIPLVLFESNALPGKVVRLFSKRALLTGIYFAGAQKHLKGKSVEVEIPRKEQSSLAPLSKEEARLQLGLDPYLMTLLVFGGSQGAKVINQTLIAAASLLREKGLAFQLIHLTGCEQTAAAAKEEYERLGISSYVKKFETRMELPWSAADMAICRSGALTVSELLHYAVPSLLIPFPAASDQHQRVNAQFLEQTVQGALHLSQDALTAETLARGILQLADAAKRGEMKRSIKAYNARQDKADLGTILTEILKKKL